MGITSADVHGWFDFAVVYDLVIQETIHDAIFVEVGVWLGKSIIYMAERVRQSQKPIRLFAVDTWYGTHSSKEQQEILKHLGNNFFQVFYDNVVNAGVIDLIKPIRLESVEASKMFYDNEVDFVFLDAAHDFNSVVQDIEAWMPKLKTTGILAGHDVSYPDVRRAVDELLFPYQIIGNSWLKRLT